MRRFVCLLALVLGCSVLSAQAQEYPKGEIFGGFSIYDAGSTMYGWQTSGAANLTEKVGLVADFGGQYSDVLGIGFSNHQFLFGPRVRTSHARLGAFAHSLVGIQRVSVSGVSANGFTMGLGGGVDWLSSSGLGLRLVQLDWLPTHYSGGWSSDQVRVGMGVILPIGRN